MADSVVTDVSQFDEESDDIPLSEVIDFGDEIDALEDETIIDETEEEDASEIPAQDIYEVSVLEENGSEEQIFDEFVDETEEIAADLPIEETSSTFEEMITTSFTEEKEEPEEEEESEEETFVSQPFDDEQFIESIKDHYVAEDSRDEILTSTAETEIIEDGVEEELENEPQALDDLTGDLVVESEDIFESVVKDIDEAIEQSEITPILKDLPLDQRLEIRKQELVSLEKTLSEEEKLKVKIQQRMISIDYYEKMNPRKVYSISVKISPTLSTKQNEHNIKLKIVPIFPGCYVTPHQEIVEINGESDIDVEFTVTPLISQGTVNGKLGIWYKGRNILNINTTSKIRNYSGCIVSSILAFLFGIMPFLFLIFNFNFNNALATGLNNIFSTTLTANLFVIFEIILLVIFLGLMVGFIFVGKPTKRKIKRKFYPVAP